MSTDSIPLGDLVEIVGGGTPSRSVPEFWNGGIPWATVKDMTSVELSETQEFISDKGVSTSATRIVPAGSVIMATRMGLGKVAINKIDLAINQDLKALKCNGNLDPKFLLYFLQSKAEYLESQGKGATVKGIKLDLVKSLPVPRLTLPEQRRIATILDKADAIRRKRRQAIDLMNDFLRSVFLEMFGDPQSNTKGWAKKRIEEIGKVVTGNTPSRANPEYYGNSVEWIKSDNINTPEHYLTKATEFLSEEGRAVGRTVPSGSVLVTCIAGSADCIGNSAIADREVAFNQQINAVIPNAECTVEFLYTLFLVSKRIIQAASTNSMKGMVSKSKFENIVIPVPPIDLQRKFSKCFDKINHSLRNLSASEKDVSYLNCSISAELFDGAST